MNNPLAYARGSGILATPQALHPKAGIGKFNDGLVAEDLRPRIGASEKKV